MSKLLVFLLFSFFIISNIMDKTFFSRITVLYLIAKVERKNSFYSKHGIIFCQKEKRSQMFQVKAISKDVRKTIVCSCYVTYAFQSESTPYSCLNVKELLARSRREIWWWVQLQSLHGKNCFVKIVTSLVNVLLKMTVCLCIYFFFTKNLMILSVFKFETLNFTMYILTISTCFLKTYVIRLHNLIWINIFHTIKDHSFFL